MNAHAAPPVVLVADDEPTMLELVSRHLRAINQPKLEVIEASDGDEAVRFLCAARWSSPRRGGNQSRCRGASGEAMLSWWPSGSLMIRKSSTASRPGKAI